MMFVSSLNIYRIWFTQSMLNLYMEYKSGIEKGLMSKVICDFYQSHNDFNTNNN